MKKPNPYYKIASLAFVVSMALGIILFMVIFMTIYEMGGGNGAIHLATLTIVADVLKWLIKVTLPIAIIFSVIGFVESRRKKYEK